MASQSGGYLYDGRPERAGRAGAPASRPAIWLARLLRWKTITVGTPRFRYAHEEVRLDAAGAAVTVTDGRSGTVADDGWWALNPAEYSARAFRTGVQPDGVDDSAADYPAGFRLQPLGGGMASDSQAEGDCANQVLVWLMLTFDFEGRSRPMVLNMLGSHDGSCE